VSEEDIDGELHHYFHEPIKLSVELLSMISSMFKVMATAPSTIAYNNNGSHGLTAFGSMEGLGEAFSTFFRRESAKPTGSRSRQPSRDLDITSKQLDRTQYCLNDGALLRDIRNMPAYETFKSMIVVLRHVKLEETLTDDNKRSCFWLNIRGTLM
jgi:hypothetical protein